MCCLGTAALSYAAGCGSSLGPSCGRPARHDTVLRRLSTAMLARVHYPPLARPPARLSARPPFSSRTRSPAIPCVRGRQYTHAPTPAHAHALARVPTHLSAHCPPAFPPACSCVISPPAHPPACGSARPSSPVCYRLSAHPPTRLPPPVCYCLRAHSPVGTPMRCRLPAQPPAHLPGSLSACVLRHLLHLPAHQLVTAAATAAAASSNILYHWIRHVQLDR